MKQKLTLCLLLLSFIGLAQAPDYINYQGIARDANGTAITGNVDLKFELHQVTANAPSVFTEAQTVSTSSLGLFSTQIGKNSNLSNINWQSGSLFLEVSLRLSGGTYTSLGTQQLVSVPYSMLAKTVPASYTNNILTIGSNAFTLTPSTSAVYTASTGIAITSGSIITNTAPDVPITFTSTSSNISVGGTYPNFSLSYTAPTTGATSIILNGAGNNNLSAGSNTVVLNTYTTGSGLTMSGGPNFTISSSASSPTITGLGAAVITPSTGTNFTVSVANPALSSSGNSVTLTQGTFVTTATIAATPATSLSPGANVSINGTNPYTIAATPTLNLLTPNTLSISGGNSVTIAPTLSVSGNGSLSVGPLSNSVNIAPNLLGTGAVTVSGVFPNYTIFATPAGSVSVLSTTVTGTNLANITSTATNLYNVDVQPPTFTPAGPVTISGTYPNYTINSNSGSTYTNGTGISITSGSIISNTSPNITPTVVITSTAAAGVSVASSGSSFSINVPPATISSSGNTLTITHGTTITTATVSGGPTTSLVPSGIVSMTATGTNSFIVGVPDPVLTSNGNTLTITQGTAVSTTTVPSITYTNGAGISITSGSIITNTSPDQVVTVASGSNINVAGTYPAYTISSPSPTFTPNGPVTISGVYPNLTINSTAAPVYTNGTGISITSGSIITNSSPDQVVTVGSGLNVNVAGTYPAYTISSPSPTFTSNGPVTITGVYPALTVNSTAAPSPTITGTGLAVVSPTTGTNITIDVPLLTYTAISGQLGSGSNTVNITAPVSLSGSTLTSGATSNSVDLSGLSPFTTSGTNVFQTTLTNSVGIGTNAPVAKLDVAATSTYVGTHFKVQNSNSLNIFDLANLSTNGLAYGLNVTNSNAATTALAAIFDGGMIAKGKNNLSTAYAFKAQNNSGSDLFVIDNTGSVGIGTVTPLAKLQVYNSSTSETSVFQTTNSSATVHALVALSNSDYQHAMRVMNTSLSSLTVVAGFFEGGLIGRAKNNAAAYAFKAQDNSGADLFTVKSDGYTEIRKSSSTGYDFSIQNTSAGNFASMQMRNAASASLGFVIGQNSTNVSILNYENTPLFFGTNGANRMVILATGEVGVGIANPGYKFTVVGAASQAAIFATNTSATALGTEHGISGLTGAFNLSSAGVVGETTGSGLGVSGKANNASGAGVKGVNQGTGPALHAQNAVGGTSALSLLLEDGHIASTQTGALSAAIGGILGGSASIVGNSTDVAGKVQIATLLTLSQNLATVTFAKAYTNAPIIVLTAANQATGSLSIYLSNVTTTGFQINATNASILTTYLLNYMAIENR